MSLKDKLKDIFVKANPEMREEIKEAVKESFNDVENSKATPSKFIDETLADGTPIMVEPAVEVGGAVTVSVDGEIVPAPDGSHELADGTVIRTVGGIIEEVISAEGEEVVEEEEMSVESNPPAPAPEMPSPKSVIERTEIEKKFASLEKAIEEKDATIEELKKDNVELSEKFEAQSKENADKLEILSGQVAEAVEAVLEFNADKPAQAPKTSVNRVNKLIALKKALRRANK
jgi:hypothetical protein